MSNNPTAEQLAEEYETGGKDTEPGGGSKGKRSKAEQAEQKHAQTGGETRKISESGASIGRSDRLNE